MAYQVELTCPGCDEEFECEWSFGDDVRCPHCGRLWSTEWETDGEDNVHGPWITGTADEG